MEKPKIKFPIEMKCILNRKVFLSVFHPFKLALSLFVLFFVRGPTGAFVGFGSGPFVMTITHTDFGCDCSDTRQCKNANLLLSGIYGDRIVPLARYSIPT